MRGSLSMQDWIDNLKAAVAVYQKMFQTAGIATDCNTIRISAMTEAEHFLSHGDTGC